MPGFGEMITVSPFGRNRGIALLSFLCGAAAFLFACRFVFPRASAYSGPLSDSVLIFVGNWTKLIALVTASLFAARCASLLDPQNPGRRSWQLLAGGLVAFSIGQATATWYQVIRGITPYRSLAELWFILSYILLSIALISFGRAYPGRATRGLASKSTLLFSIAVVIAWFALRPLGSTPASSLSIALNVACPALDIVLLVPAFVLPLITGRFRVANIDKVWVPLLVGVTFMTMGDVLFAYVTAFDLTFVDALVQATYFISYGAIAIAAIVQHGLLAPRVLELTPA